MTDPRRVVRLPADESTRRLVAEWSVREWSGFFPGDDEQTYLDLFAEADRSSTLPRVWVSIDEHGAPTGTASLVVDDELPDADEPGPWVAAVYVHPSSRGRGDGRRLVGTAVRAAGELGHERVWIYTHHARDWYEAMGWSHVRTTTLAGRDVDVMVTTTRASG